jgi:hypothetical protein
MTCSGLPPASARASLRSLGATHRQRETDLARHHPGDVAMTHGTVQVDGCELPYVREGHGPSMMIIGSASYYQKTFSLNLSEFVDS